MARSPSWLTPERSKVLIDHIQDGIFVIQDGGIVYVNQILAELCGENPEAMLGRPFTDFIAAEDRDLVAGRYAARQRGEPTPDVYAFRLRVADGGIREIQASIGVAVDEHDCLTSVGTVRDITREREMIRRLVASQQDIQSILDNLPDVFYRTDMTGVITMISSSCFDGLGYTAAEMTGRNMADFYADPAHRERVVKALVQGGGRARHVEAALRHKNGEPCWVSTNAYIRVDAAGKPYCIEGIARNVTERKQIEDRLAHMAQTDDLTGLLNRRHFFSTAGSLTRLARRYQRRLSVAMVDVDHFKQVNDHAGHAAGDQVLIVFANLCRELVRENDLIGRLGGEEFGLLMPETDLEMARQTAERLRVQLEATPVRVKGRAAPLHVTVSIGVAEMRGDEDLEALIRRADDALYRAKQAGRNRVI